jgi:hypothetical protein
MSKKIDFLELAELKGARASGEKEKGRKRSETPAILPFFSLIIRRPDFSWLFFSANPLFLPPKSRVNSVESSS